MTLRFVVLYPPQGMHEVAYSGGLARPLIAPESALAGLKADALAEFVARNYTPSRMTLAGAGVTQARLGLCSSTIGLVDYELQHASGSRRGFPVCQQGEKGLKLLALAVAGCRMSW